MGTWGKKARSPEAISPNVQKSGSPNDQKSRMPEVQRPEVQMARSPNIQKSKDQKPGPKVRSPDVQKLDGQKSRWPDGRMARSPDKKFLGKLSKRLS